MVRRRVCVGCVSGDEGEAPRRWAGAGRTGVALAFVLLLTACAPARHFPPGYDPTVAAPARIDEGRGVRFLRVDGQEISRRSILVAPGERSLRFDVRRALGPLDEEKFEGIYRVGSCRIRFEAEANRHYEVYTEIFADERTRITRGRPRPIDNEPETETVVGLTVHVKDLETGRNRRLSADSCDLKLDCSRLNRLYSRIGKECSG